MDSSSSPRAIQKYFNPFLTSQRRLYPHKRKNLGKWLTLVAQNLRRPNLIDPAAFVGYVLAPAAQVLGGLAEVEAHQSKIVELRYFGGLSIEETSQYLGISPPTLKRSWASARAWLLREMNRREAQA